MYATMMDPTSSDEGTTLPKKRARTNCIIHCSADDSDALVYPQDLNSWKSLLRAAEIRQHTPVLDLAVDLEEGKIPDVQYHRKCRSIFTMKRDLDSILSKGTSVDPSTLSSRRSSRGTPSTSRVYDQICIFCNKSSRYLKGQKTREPLVQCIELRADNTVRSAATRKCDQRVLALLSRDLVAAEGHYHKSCYRLYTKGESSVSSGVAGEQEQSGDADYEEAERQAYEDLFLYIRNELLPEPEILLMTDLTSRLERSMNSLGITQIKPSTKKHVRRKLENELSRSLHFVSTSPLSRKPVNG